MTYRAECEVCGTDLEDSNRFPADEPIRCNRWDCQSVDLCDECQSWRYRDEPHVCEEDRVLCKTADCKSVRPWLEMIEGYCRPCYSRRAMEGKSAARGGSAVSAS